MEFYRYVLREYARMSGIDGEPVHSYFPDPRLVLEEYHLVRETAKGYWISYGSYIGFHSSARWVSKTSRKRFAYPTKEEALHNFVKRTQKRIHILRRQLESSEQGLILATRLKTETDDNKQKPRSV